MEWTLEVFPYLVREGVGAAIECRAKLSERGDERQKNQKEKESKLHPAYFEMSFLGGSKGFVRSEE